MAATIRCPHCSVENPAPATPSPFFCKGCHQIVSPGGSTKADRPAAAPPPPMRGGAGAPPSATAAREPTSYVSRYGGADPRDASAPGVGFNVGGSLMGGLALAAMAGGIVGAALGYAGAQFVSLPIVSAFIVGWTLKRALAAGAGGGTPDRGVVGGILFLAIVLAVPGLMRWLEYRAASETWNARAQSLYTKGAAAAVDDVAAARNTLRILDTDADGQIVLPAGAGTVFVDEELQRLAAAKATGKRPSDGYDVELLASTGKQGFYGHVYRVLRKGDTLRIPGTQGVTVPGFAMVALWLIELLILVTVAFSRVE